MTPIRLLVFGGAVIAALRLTLALAARDPVPVGLPAGMLPTTCAEWRDATGGGHGPLLSGITVTWGCRDDAGGGLTIFTRGLP